MKTTFIAYERIIDNLTKRNRSVTIYSYKNVYKLLHIA